MKAPMTHGSQNSNLPTMQGLTLFLRRKRTKQLCKSKDYIRIIKIGQGENLALKKGSDANGFGLARSYNDGRRKLQTGDSTPQKRC